MKGFAHDLALAARRAQRPFQFRGPLGGGMFGGGGGPALKLREVGTRGCIPNSFFATTNAYNSRNAFYIRGGAVKALQFAWCNWYMNNGTETPSGGVMTLHAALEYPLGTTPRRPILFGGSQTGTAASGATLVSDRLAIDVPDNSLCRVWTQGVNTAGYCFTAGPWKKVGGTLDDASVYNSGASNFTQTGTFADDGVSFCFAPTRVMGLTAGNSDCMLLVDSRGQGLGESQATQDDTGNCGDVPRAIGPTHAYWRQGGSGMTVNQYLGGNARQLALAALSAAPAYMFVQAGFNDLRTGRSSAQLVTDVLAAIALNPGALAYFNNTLAPWTTSTDAWATLVNQAAASGAANTQIALYNALTRGAGIGGGVIGKDVAQYLEPAIPSAVWQVTGGTGVAAYTGDGVHATALADKLVVVALP